MLGSNVTIPAFLHDTARLSTTLSSFMKKNLNHSNLGCLYICAAAAMFALTPPPIQLKQQDVAFFSDMVASISDIRLVSEMSD